MLNQYGSVTDVDSQIVLNVKGHSKKAILEMIDHENSASLGVMDLSRRQLTMLISLCSRALEHIV